MLPPESLPMPPCWKNLLEEAGRGVFARRSTLRLFLTLASGLVLAERGTVVAMAAGGGSPGSGGGPAGSSRARPGTWMPWAWRRPG
jgi:hypothetical protein